MSLHTTILCSIFVLIAIQNANQLPTNNSTSFAEKGQNITELPQPLKILNIKILREKEKSGKNITLSGARKLVNTKNVPKTRKPSMVELALQTAARQGLEEMSNLYTKIEPDIVKMGHVLDTNHPASLLSKFSAPDDGTENIAKAAFASLVATKVFRQTYRQTSELGRQADAQRITFRRTALEGLCPPRELPICLPAAQRYRTHDGTCNNSRRPRWGAAQMPFNRFLPPEYGDGIDSIRAALDGGALPSARFVSLLVHGSRDGDAPITLMLAQWGQLVDHDVTSTAQPRSINGSVPRCCGPNDFHPSCFPIKVPIDDPWLSPLKVRCLEFLRSAPAQRRDCVLSWREQTNQATSYIDASPVYSSNARASDVARVFRNGLLVFGRGNPVDDVCMRGAIGHQCIRAGDGRSGEQPGLLALHHVWVGEHNRVALELSTLNPHWSDEKVYQETRRIIGALFQHITYREFLPIVLGREVSKLFDLDLLNSGYYTGYDQRVNPSVGNSFSAAAFRFGHSLVQGSYMRCDRNHRFLESNVTLHEEFQRGDIGTPGSLHRLLRGLSAQRALKRDEFITAELTNHLFQTDGFPFGLDLAAINIQRGRDHGIPPYTQWREPCGLSTIKNWEDLENVVGSESRKRIGNAYTSVHDIDLFVGGIAERPVLGGLVGPTFACIIAQQFSNLRKGDRFWYENPGFESSFTPAQLDSIRRVSLAQVMCRAVGGGTFQPHIFMPHEFSGNERVPCNTGPLAPIDLLPWLEQDPFRPIDQTDITTQKPPFEAAFEPTFEPTPTTSVTEQKDFSNLIHNMTTNMVTHVDFTPNGSTGFHRPENITKINDKLDFGQKLTRKPTLNKLVHNQIEKGHLKLGLTKTRTSPSPHRQSLGTTTRRTVIINNVAIELRSAQDTNKTKASRKDSDEKTIKEDLNETDSPTVNLTTKAVGRSLNLTDLGTTTETEGRAYKTNNFSTKQDATTKSISNSPDVLLQLRQYPGDSLTTRPQTLILDGPNSNQYEIEINIKQSNRKHGQNNYVDRNYNTNSHYNYYDYNNPQIVTSSTPFSYPVGGPVTTTQQPAYNNIHNDYAPTIRTKPPTIIYLNDDGPQTTTTTRSPGFLQSILSFGSGRPKPQPPPVSTNPDKVTNSNVFSENHNQQQQQQNYNANYNGHLPYPGGVSASSHSNHNYLGQTRPSPYPSPGGVSASSHSNIGLAQATSTATSSGHYGTIVGSASSNNGGDSTFSFNIRPTQRPELDIQSTGRPTYGLIPAGRPQTQYADSYYGPLDSYGNRRTSTQSQYSYSPSTGQPYYTKPDGQYNPFASPFNNRPTYGTPNRPPSSDPYGYLQRKTISLSTDQLGRSDLKLNSTSDYDYEMTTFMPPKKTDTNEDYEYDEYDTDVEPAKKFDQDGYLRPEHMVLNLVTNDRQAEPSTSKKVDDNYVFPMLNRTQDGYKKDENQTVQPDCDKDGAPYPDSLPKRLSADIFAEDDFDYELPRTIDAIEIAARNFRKRPLLLSHAAFAPINVLTKPERPDNWVIYESLEMKPLLPRLPELVSESTTADELPTPLGNPYIGIKKRFYETSTQPTSTTTTTTTTTTERPTVDATTTVTKDDITETSDQIDTTTETDTMMTTTEDSAALYNDDDESSQTTTEDPIAQAFFTLAALLTKDSETSTTDAKDMTTDVGELG